MLVVCVANPFMSLVISEKKFLVLPVPIDDIDDFLISELLLEPITIEFVDEIAVSLISSSKLSSC